VSAIGITVEVVYARPDQQITVELMLLAGATVTEAIEQSGITLRFPEIDLTRNKIGIYGKLVDTQVALRDRDRVEIYRPLIADPKEARRKRVREARSTQKKEG